MYVCVYMCMYVTVYLHHLSCDNALLYLYVFMVICTCTYSYTLFAQGKIPDIAAYLRQPWVSAVYHERIRDMLAQGATVCTCDDV